MADGARVIALACHPLSSACVYGVERSVLCSGGQLDFYCFRYCVCEGGGGVFGLTC